MLAGHVAATDQAGEQDLDVDFVVGTIDAGRVVDRVGEYPAAVQRKLDAALLRQPRLPPSPITLALSLSLIHIYTILGDRPISEADCSADPMPES